MKGWRFYSLFENNAVVSNKGEIISLRNVY